MKRTYEKKVTATELRQHLFSYLNEVERGDKSLVVERNGKPQVVVMGFGQYRATAKKEARAAQNLIKELRAFHQDYLEAHGGKVTSNSVDLIRQLREES
jgi:prevent-host-death family protein